MNYWPSMTWRTEGIHVTDPVKWRCLDGLMGAFWEAECLSGASGYYLADDPRIMFFFNDVSGKVRISNHNGDFIRQHRPMTRAIYIPAGVPMWTNIESTHHVTHLNLHIHKDRLLRFLAPSVGRSAALTALRRPVEIQDADGIETLARLLVGEISDPSRHAVYAESLVGSIVTGLLDIPDRRQDQPEGRLTQGQMKKLTGRGNGRLSVAEMADIVGLSESWFSTVFKQTTGKTPLQWQLERRVETAKRLLAETDLSVATIAAQLEFSDQAHLTKVFRHVAGETPAAWRRMQGR